MVSYVTKQLRKPLLQSSMSTAVRVVQYGIPQSLTIALPCWSYITPIHVPSSPQAESYHKMYEVSGLLMGEMLYEEYIPGTEEFYSKEGGSISL